MISVMTAKNMVAPPPRAQAFKEAAAAYLSTPAPTAADDIDSSLIEDSLRLTPWQRLVENDRALGLVRMLEEAGIRTHGASDANPRTSES
jgi:hypothetical protein